MLLFCTTESECTSIIVQKNPPHNHVVIHWFFFLLLFPELAFQLSKSSSSGLCNNHLYSSAIHAAPRFTSAVHTALPPIPSHEYISIHSQNGYMFPDTPAWSEDYFSESSSGNTSVPPTANFVQKYDIRSSSSSSDSHLETVPPMPQGYPLGPLMTARRSITMEQQNQHPQNDPTITQHGNYSTIQPKVRMGTASIRRQYCPVPMSDSYEMLQDIRPQETFSEFDAQEFAQIKNIT